MTFRSTFVAAAAVFSVANAHMIMKDPVPYSLEDIDNGPISASQFPCKSHLGYKVSKVTPIAVGESKVINFRGSAVHNGGLCQLSVALTREPDENTVFKVIKTIEGGCPGIGGPEEFEYQLPESIPNGEATFAWTWMPTSSGGPEYYMNCAPIEVSGGASDESGFNQLPDMLVANLPEKTDCTQVVNTVLQPPNPGDVVEVRDNSREHSPPTGNCGSSGGGGSPPVQRRSSTSTTVEEPTAAPSNPGGVFAPGASSAPAESSTVTTLVTVTGTSSAPVGTGSPAQPPVGTDTPPAPKPTGGNPKDGSSCSPDGAIVCNGEYQFGLCNHGTVVWQDVAAGTMCKQGTIQRRSYNGRIARPVF